MSDDEINSILYEHSDFDEPDAETEEFMEESVAFKIASAVMENLNPGFVIIASPLMGVTKSGSFFPDSIAIVVNDEVGITKTNLADILLHLATRLNEDMDKISAFVAEATNND